MAATPPHQITFTPDTPSTPRHGPLYDSSSPNTRSSARLRQKKALDSTKASEHGRTHVTPPVKTPTSPKDRRQIPSINLQSPSSTPKRKAVRQIQIHSPTSPNTDLADLQVASVASTRLRPYNSVTTSMGNGMLPTPVKTPKKKQVSKSNLAGRALFQDGTSISEMAQSPRKQRKTRRYNGFSLESFRADDSANGGSIQIFTDSRDQIPEADTGKENPFVQPVQPTSKSERVPGTVKRRRVSHKRASDPQVEEALRNDEGMVYVFRGKKVFRRFDDTGEEEEEIEADDLGLLEHATPTSGGTRRFKTLTRKSIKPTRLFQTSEQKRLREEEKEEEATTDIDDTVSGIDDRETVNLLPAVETASGKSSRATTSIAGHKAHMLPKKASGFETWSRSKPSASKPSRGQKRAHVDDQDDGQNFGRVVG